ncbi:MAG: hypothetical protein B7Z75_00775 [Acidocella sp. 20-57-95]|nr:MAG: hypothetical protein B7Z75_00775 [Acidocella sp. 20-57-95]OYV62334.1 MAG: hypothetical protein B7Z71_01615 [Acidocella sp. 21-58-7]HQT63230.1 DUF2155 domain-containing protein [Acidocella sp.]HQU03783.1 DUF2155 domain-containing protein [Acidocella sp.]
MRRSLIFAALLAASSSFFAEASAQALNNVVVPPAPPLVAQPATATPPQSPDQATPPPPGLVQNAPPASTATAATPPAGPGASAVPPTGTNQWVPGQQAELGVLDKVDGGISNLQIPVGGHAISGDIQISVLACVNRPAGQLPDSAIFLSIQTTDNLTGPPLYRGWVVRSVPGDAVVGDAGESLRVVGCT